MKPVFLKVFGALFQQVKTWAVLVALVEGQMAIKVPLFST